MSNIHVIGSNGFVGKAIKKVSKNREDIKFYSSNEYEKKFKIFDIRDEKTWKNINIEKNDKLIFLTWRNLPNYNEPFHITENLIDSIKFIKYILQKNISKLIITGTCYEYGLQNGMLSEDSNPEPLNSYSLAKDCLRKLTQCLCTELETEFLWLRIFYPYGKGQNPNSLIPSLERAIENKEESFNLSKGNQIRDFIKVEDVAQIILKLTDSPKANGIYNVGSGKPISIKDFIKAYIKRKDSDIKLNFGYYPERKNEPNAFWADTQKLNSILKLDKKIT